jgi:ADP-heptose:LPS heptosyltransferase
VNVLAIQFRYLGDAVLLTPALRAVKEHFAGCSLHVLVAEEIAPVLQHIPWIHRVWAFPRTRGRATIARCWPMLHELRREQFDLSIDFGGNDRGAIVSFLSGAKQRVGPAREKGFVGRRFCYTDHVPLPPPAQPVHEMQADFRLLSLWGIGALANPLPEINADPALAAAAEQLLPGRPILCHVATSQPKKEWPLAHWAEFQRLAREEGLDLVFCAGPAEREQALLRQFKERAGQAATLAPVPDLAMFLAVLKRTSLFVSGDTGPLHLAAGLGVPTVGLFGPSTISQWAPQGPAHRALQGSPCTCSALHTSVCRSASPCMAAIAPEAALKLIAGAPREGTQPAGRGYL